MKRMRRALTIWWCKLRYGHPGYDSYGGHCRRCGFPYPGETEY